MKKFLSMLLAALLCASVLAGFAASSEADESNSMGGAQTQSDSSITDSVENNNLELLKEKLKTARIGLMTGTLIVDATEELYPDAEILLFNDEASTVEALKAGKVDYVISTRASGIRYAYQNNDLCVIEENVLDIADTWIAAAVRKGYDKLPEINRIIERYLSDGTMDKIKDNWLGEDKAYDKSIIPVDQSAPIWKVGISAHTEPMSFIDGDGDFCGIDPELAQRIAYDMGMRVEFVNMDFSALIPALQSERVDFVIANMGVTEERKELVDFTTQYFDNGYVVLAQRTEENLSFVSGSDNNPSSGEELSDKKLQTAKFGVMTGTVAGPFLKNAYPDATIFEFDSIGDAVEALKANKVDYVMTAYSTAQNYERNNDDLYVPDRIMEDEDVAAAVKKGNTELLNKLNELLAQYKSNGTMDKILANWFGEDGKDPAYDTSDIPVRGSDAPVLKVGIAANREPMCFVLNDSYSGLDYELIMRMAYDMGMRVEFSDMTFSSLIPALQSGKVDVVISSVVYTEERSKVVDFTESYFDNPQVLIQKKTTNGVIGETQNASGGFWEGLKDSFVRTFITENRWKLVLSGLGVTLLISLCAFVIGSLWGAVICALLRSKKKIAYIPARVYIRLLQGTPIVVLLMILYYIVFKSFDISAIIVAIIGFALNLGAYTSEVFRTAIDSVDKGQIEAASAMGFNKFQVFIKIIFPQAARNALPVYKGEFISLVKSTSIVGYIAIQDLTKVSDIIRSRTYEAFFPLIATAIIYFAVTYVFIVLMNVLEKKIDPKRRKRRLKGVALK